MSKLIKFLELDKMSGFFLESQKVGDKSSIQCILEEIGGSDIEFGCDILFYAIENFNNSIQKVFENLFKDSELEGGKMD